jgi:urease accessory protein
MRDAWPGVETAVDAVRLSLRGGWVGTAWAGEPLEAVARLASVAGHPDLVAVAW